MVEVVETSSDGRERLHMMFLCHAGVVGTAGYAPIGPGQNLIFAALVYQSPAGKGLNITGGVQNHGGALYFTKGQLTLDSGATFAAQFQAGLVSAPGVLTLPEGSPWLNPEM